MGLASAGWGCTAGLPSLGGKYAVSVLGRGGRLLEPWDSCATAWPCRSCCEGEGLNWLSGVVLDSTTNCAGIVCRPPLWDAWPGSLAGGTGENNGPLGLLCPKRGELSMLAASPPSSSSSSTPPPLLTAALLLARTVAMALPAPSACTSAPSPAARPPVLFFVVCTTAGVPAFAAVSSAASAVTVGAGAVVDLARGGSPPDTPVPRKGASFTPPLLQPHASIIPPMPAGLPGRSEPPWLPATGGLSG
eukprot:1160401-Pelagomonas_calceolata.AAC.12